MSDHRGRAVVDDEGGSGPVARQIRSEVRHGATDLGRLPQSPSAARANALRLDLVRDRGEVVENDFAVGPPTIDFIWWGSEGKESSRGP
ncbi:hypothetical protein [Streptomyces sp. NPDC088178]|uniref:hypothetical protein n=1 Tax=Streptomyces sp. NPDC088178 TaxID=3365836 RepID=UPI003806F2CB